MTTSFLPSSFCMLPKSSTHVSSASPMSAKSSKYKLAMVAIFLTFLPQLTFGSNPEIWKGYVTISIPINSDRFSPDLRDEALFRLKVKAGEQAGAYVIRTTTLTNDIVSESAEIISASIVSFSNMSERIDIKKNIQVLSLTALATVDLSSAKERLHYVMENKELREELSRLGKSYANALRSRPTPVEYALITEGERSLNRNLSSAERESLIFAGRTKVEAGKREFVDEVVRMLKERSHLSVTLERVTKSGEEVAYHIRVGFSAPLIDINRIVSKIWESRLRLDASHPFILINGRNLSSERFTRSESEELFDALANEHLSIQVAIGEHSSLIPILYEGNAFRPGCRVNAPENGAMTICITNIVETLRDPLNTSSVVNPVVIVVPNRSSGIQDDSLITAKIVSSY